MNYSPELSRLMLVTWDHAQLSHEEQVGIAVSAGARLIQLRMKEHAYEFWKGVAGEVQKLAAAGNATLIINDSVSIVNEVGADGVHLGKQDMDPVKARELLGSGKIIGGTANTMEDVQRLVDAGVQYIGLGPFRFTSTKLQLDPVLGMEGIKEILAECRKRRIDTPVYIIGGVVAEDIAEILSAGAYGIAVSSAILKDPIPGQAIEYFLTELEKYS